MSEKLMEIIDWKMPIYNADGRRVYFEGYNEKKNGYIVDGWEFNFDGTPFVIKKMSGVINQRGLPHAYRYITNDNPYRKKLSTALKPEQIDQISNFGVM